MSQHHKEETIICPNCGFHATKNYCAQCGQETHLHKETFFGLIFHFVSHYFHYDSKFWQTLKTLVTKPGKLTVEYWEKKRARYIPPISLYIFVSAVFFIIFFSTVGSKKTAREIASYSQADTVSTTTNQDSAVQYVSLTPEKKKSAETVKKARAVFNDPEKTSEIFEVVFHAFPKFFFFLIPLMAFVLKLLYIRRKDCFYVAHAVFSLHIHAFSMIAFLFALYMVPEKNLKWYDHAMSVLQSIMQIVVPLYLMLAIRNAYRSGWLRSFFYAALLVIVYIFFFFLLFVVYFIVTAGQAIEGAAH